jgi:cytochrome P450
VALPPGPRSPALVQSLQFLTSQRRTSDRFARKYGDVFSLKGIGFGRLIVVSDPELVKELFKTDPGTAHAGEGNRILKPILGENSVLVLDEAEHMRQRKLMLPSFHGDRMRVYGDLIEQIARAEIERWPRGEPFELLPSMQAITLRVILRAIFGIEEGAQLTELEAAIRQVVNVPEFYLLIPAMQRRPVPAHARFKRNIAEVDRLLFAEIAKRRGEELDGREDVLSRLLAARDDDGNAMSDQEVRDELLTLLVAGHETTATALSWFFERILRHPSALSHAKEDDRYLEAAIRESLRVRPILHFAMRRTTKPLQLGDHDIPVGATVGASAYLMHRRPGVYPDPEAYRPERFLDGQGGTYTWLPFGGGIRRCLGAAFALYEMQVIARTVFANVELTVPDPRPEREKRRGITFIPAKGARVVARA